MSDPAHVPGLYAKHYRLADGTRRISSWYYQPPWADTTRPRPKPVRLGTKDRDDAAARIGRILVRGLADDRSDHASVLLARAVDEKLALGQWSAKTAQDARSTIRRLLRDLGDPRPAFISPDDMRDWYKSMLSGGLATSSAQHHLRNVRSMFAALIAMGVLEVNPAAALRLPSRRESRREKFCTAAQRDLLISRCDRPDLGFLLHCGFHAGMRVGEIIAARPHWLTIAPGGASGHITVQRDPDWRPKTSRDRTIPLSRAFLAFLATYPATGDYLLRPDVKKGADHYRWNPRRPFADHARACGLDWVTPHTMRHTFGSLHTMAGTPELKIRRWMGISAHTFEQHYAGLDPHDDAINL